MGVVKIWGFCLKALPFQEEQASGCQGLFLETLMRRYLLYLSNACKMRLRQKGPRQVKSVRGIKDALCLGSSDIACALC